MMIKKNVKDITYGSSVKQSHKATFNVKEKFIGKAAYLLACADYINTDDQPIGHQCEKIQDISEQENTIKVNLKLSYE